MQAENQHSGWQMPHGCSYTNGLPLLAPATSLTTNLCCAGTEVPAGAFAPHHLSADPEGLGSAGRTGIQPVRDILSLSETAEFRCFPTS